MCSSRAFWRLTSNFLHLQWGTSRLPSSSPLNSTSSTMWICFKEGKFCKTLLIKLLKWLFCCWKLNWRMFSVYKLNYKWLPPLAWFYWLDGFRFVSCGMKFWEELEYEMMMKRCNWDEFNSMNGINNLIVWFNLLFHGVLLQSSRECLLVCIYS